MAAGVAERFGGRRGWLLALSLALLLRLPFLNQAIQGDEHIYLTEAAHAQVEPLHPTHTSYVFLGDVVDLRGHSHPPLNAWALGALVWAFGGVREVPFHAAYMGFSVLALWAMWRLAQRFSERPLWATLLFWAAPAFVVNGASLESDLPFLAFWLAAVALYVEGRLWLAAACMALATMAAYQGVFLIPVLGAYCWLNHRGSRAHWLALATPALTVVAWQAFERAATGAAPAGVLTGYFASYGFQALQKKLASALMLFIHSWFIVFPGLAAGAAWLAWRRRGERDNQFLLAWIGLFYLGAVAVFFAGSARYLLPMAAPVALLASRLKTRWVAAGFAAQLALSLGLAVVNYQHWEGYRAFAKQVEPLWPARGRMWVDDEWGLRHYLGERGGLALSKSAKPQPGDLIVTSALAHSVDVVAPKTQVLSAVIQPAIPLRLVGLESHSGYSSVAAGFWPFGFTGGVIDRVKAELVQARRAEREYLAMDAAEVDAQAVSGVFALEGKSRWISTRAVFAMKNPAAATPLRAVFYAPPNAPARRAVLRLDGKEVAALSWTADGRQEVVSAPVRGAGASATVELELDRGFRAPGDSRSLGVVLMEIGFSRQ